ncbi:MAG: T9SS type A sorting domain-containing protein [Flavobacteriales bacterium]
MRHLFNILAVFIFYANLSASDFSEHKGNPSIEEESNVRIYPNPVKDLFYISSHNNMPIKQIIIFNIVGHKILDYSPKHPSNKEQINISRLASGKYFIKVLLNNRTQEIKHLIKL